MLTEICQYLRNWFTRDILLGKFVVEDNVIKAEDGTALPLITGQYYRIVGSIMNDGVHQWGTKEVTTNNVTTEQLIDPLVDEPEFSGAVWSMAVPPVMVQLDADITQWLTDNAAAINSPYASESFGGYSYSLRSGSSGAEGKNSGATWQGQFATRLAPWRKI